MEGGWGKIGRREERDQKRLGYKENDTKYRSLSSKPQSHVRILIYRTRPIGHYRVDLDGLLTSLSVLRFRLARIITAVHECISVSD